MNKSSSIEPIISIEHLTKHYPQTKITALSGVSIQVDAGQIFGIIRKSDSGESTLLRCINLLERPNSGTVTVSRINLTTANKTQLRAARQKIGIIFQHFNLLQSKTVFANIALPLILQTKYTQAEIKAKVDKYWI